MPMQIFGGLKRCIMGFVQVLNSTAIAMIMDSSPVFKPGFFQASFMTA